MKTKVEYSIFKEIYKKKIGSQDDFYVDLLIKMIKNPNRFISIFRASSIKMKIIQFITQSNEIKFGDFLEEIIKLYLEYLGFEQINSKIKNDENQRFNIDQIFIKKNIIYITEQKVRDDHDSTKKVGQFDNFIEKIKIINNLYPNYTIKAYMWFIDENQIKNKRYYENKINKISLKNVKIALVYGKDYFLQICPEVEIWNDLINNLKHLKNEISHNLEIPDFDNDNIIYEALLNLPKKLWDKLNSNNVEMSILRDNLFQSKHNLNKAKKMRGDK
ncbi:HpyAIV family type II restriction enzyme [Mycoplasma crocodyli]|uniref:type II site-specific deoxyribonuclease n=1 Tax=Mycoplasma crocodyli (strain ATCC 51981 / MP145) TaxID=512564 RepID=D5E5Y8_MYCCM|nr:hypothetical protein [Mycoplasma crocodyli]ADE19530.1 probable type II restriction endonuclease [Mycoplasma crocodyli MP145]